MSMVKASQSSVTDQDEMSFEEVKLVQDKNKLNQLVTPNPEEAPVADLEKSVHYDMFDWDAP